MTQMAVMVAPEATHGTVGTTFVSVPCDFDSEMKQTNKVIDEGRQGQDMNFAMVQGRKWQEFSIGDSMVYHDTIGLWLASAFGAPTKAVVDTIFDNTYKFADDPKSLSIKWDQPLRSTQPYQVLNANIDKISFKFDAEGELTYSASGVSLAEATVAAPTYAFSSVRPFASWAGAVTLEGSGAGVYANLRSGVVNVSRNRKPFPTIRNNAEPAKFSIGQRVIDFELTLDFVNLVSYDRFKNGTSDALTIKWVDAGVTIGTVSNPEFEIKLGTIYHETAKPDVSGDLPVVSLKGKAVYNSGDASTGVIRVRSSRDYTLL